MKICLLADASSVHTVRWIDSFADRGWQVDLVSLESPAVPIRAAFHHLAPSTPFPAFNYPLAVPAVQKIFRAIRPDLVNAHFVPNYGFAAALACARPLVVSAWGSDLLVSAEKSFLHRQRARFVLNRADLVTVDAPILARAALQLGTPPPKTLCVPMGVDLERWPFHHPLTRDRIQVVSWRRLEPVTNLALLIRAIPAIRARLGGRIRFVVAGEGSQKKSLETLAVRLGVADSVRFPGALTAAALSALIAESDIYVSTARSDSTSVSLLEAMASGLLPVVTDIPGNRDWIDHEVNGLLFPSCQPDLLSRAIISAVEHPGFARTATGRNRAIVARRASWPENMKIIKNAFQKLIRD